MTLENFELLQRTIGAQIKAGCDLERNLKLYHETYWNWDNLGPVKGFLKRICLTDPLRQTRGCLEGVSRLAPAASTFLAENQRLFPWAWRSEWPRWRIHSDKGPRAPWGLWRQSPGDSQKTLGLWAVESWPWPPWAWKEIPSWAFRWEHGLVVSTAASWDPEKRTLPRPAWTSNKNYEIYTRVVLILQLMVISMTCRKQIQLGFASSILCTKLPPR